MKDRNRDLCPGEDFYLDKKEELSNDVFDRLVTRRIRKVASPEDRSIAATKGARKEMELQLEKVNEEADFLPVGFLSDGSARANAVCRVVVPISRNRRSLGTGFLVAPNLIMTNNHVISDKEEAQDALAQFFFEQGGTTIGVAIRPDIFFVTNKALDYTIVGCEGTDIHDISPITLNQDSSLVSRHDRVNIIQHPRGRQKEIALHDNRVHRVMKFVLKYFTDTEPGSSGSPVFDNEWNLVALHHAGRNLPGGKAENEGIRIVAIINDLKKKMKKDGDNKRDIWVSLFSHINDFSSELGIFGTTGLGLEDLEVQVNGFQGSPQFADIGCWNIEHFNNNVSDERVKAVAQVLEKMALDAIGLSEVQTSAMNRLVEEMNSNGGNYDFVLRDVSGNQDLAVLFDRDTCEVERLPHIAERNNSSLRARTSDNKTAFPRFPMFAHCKVKHESDEVEFIMIVVHLKAFGDRQSRARRKLAAEKLALIIDDIRENENLPVVLCGDFNERLDNDTLKSIKDTPDLFALTSDDAQDDAISYVGRRHRSLIDHIIVTRDVQLGDISGDDAAIVRLDRTIRNFADEVSDHVPLVMRLIIREEEIPDVPESPASPPNTEVNIPENSTKVKIVFE